MSNGSQEIEGPSEFTYFLGAISVGCLFGSVVMMRKAICDYDDTLGKILKGASAVKLLGLSAISAAMIALKL